MLDHRIKECLNKHLDLIVCAVCVFAIEGITQWLIFKNISIQVFLWTGCWIFPLCPIIGVFSRRKRFVTENVLITILTIYSVVQIYYFAFFANMFSFKSIAHTKELFVILPEILIKFKFEHLIIFIPLLCSVIYLIKNWNKKELESKITAISKYFLILAFFADITGGLILNINTATNAKDLYDSNRYYFNNRWQTNYAYQNFGSIKFLVDDIRHLIIKSHNINEEQIEEMIQDVRTEKNEMSGIFENKNIILVLCESLGDNVIDEELTPTLWKMKNEGINFSNYYAPLFPSHTADSEFAVLTGLVPSIDYGSTNYTFENNTYPMALANLFNEKGYISKSFHSFYGDFYNRKIIHKNFGFEHFYDNEDLDLWTDGVEWGNWVSDEKLFKKSLELTDFSKPFFNFIISVSGHAPYSDTRKELDSYVEKINSSHLKNLNVESKYYLASQMELDNAFAHLIEGLKEKGELDDTVIVLFGDHYPYGFENEETKENFLNKDKEVYKTPFIIWTSNIKSLNCKTLASQVDINPTLSNMFGLSTECFRFGKDIFNKDEKFVIFPDREIFGNIENKEQMLERIDIDQEILWLNYFKEY